MIQLLLYITTFCLSGRCRLSILIERYHACSSLYSIYMHMPETSVEGRSDPFVPMFSYRVLCTAPPQPEDPNIKKYALTKESQTSVSASCSVSINLCSGMIKSLHLFWLVPLLLANGVNGFRALSTQSPARSFSFTHTQQKNERHLKPLSFHQRSSRLHAIEDGGQELGFTLKVRNPFDVHVYYDIPDQQKEALALRDKMQRRFEWMRFYEPRKRPIGPHPIPMWEADFGVYENRHKWREVCEFLEEEHGDLSVLVHPHSIDGDYADHTDNAKWIGTKQELLIEGWKR
jgi:aromatic ring-cleaving dioxygenase